MQNIPHTLEEPRYVERALSAAVRCPIYRMSSQPIKCETDIFAEKKCKNVSYDAYAVNYVSVNQTRYRVVESKSN